MPTEISSEAEEVQEMGEEEENNGRMQEKGTDEIEQPIVEESEVSKKPISKGRNTATSTVAKLKSLIYNV